MIVKMCRQLNRSRKVKRAFDLVGASFAIAVTLLPMAAAAAVIRLTLGAPVLFRQERPGLGGAPFVLCKFRTMSNATAGEAEPSDDQQRLTALGTVLRRGSLDELPELFNVIAGDMSLVGPRPLLPQYLARYTPEQARRHELKPGITGWAQVKGRNALSWDEKFALDVWYVDNWTVGLDLKILWMTVLQVVQRRGINAEGCATMPEFMGTAADKAEA